ncbi:MAG: sensor histidine kinase [Lachnospiraceae bacterium]|nr:sensor histidine kinase [Lachnospiraceae bacterium]
MSANGVQKTKNSKKSLSGSLKSLIIVLVFLVIAAFVISMFIIVDNERRAYEISESEGVLRTMSDSIESSIVNFTEVSRLIITDSRLVEFLRARSDKVDMGMINDARFGVLDILYVTGGVDSVMIFREDMIMMTTDRTSYEYHHELIEDEEWRNAILDAKGRAVISINGNGAINRKDGRPVITIAREINDVLTQRRTGIMLMNISADEFERTLGKLNYDNICIAGDEGTYLAGNSEIMKYYPSKIPDAKVMHNSIDMGRNGMLFSCCRVGDLPIMIMRLSTYGSEGIPYSLLYVMLFLMIFLIAAVFIVATFITRNLTRPVYDLSEKMEMNREVGTLEQIDIDVAYRELDMLKEGYNNLVVHVEELITTLVDKEQSLREAEMRVLQEQIKPHFLYNSLETIGFLALDAGADNVHNALETLGSFYRNFLNKGAREIPFGLEVRIVKDYLSLQKLRYGDIIEDTYDIPEDTESLIVPKLILQPLVENSIYHGIRLTGEKGIISIASRNEEGTLHVVVRDTGIGISEDQIKKLLDDEPGKIAEDAMNGSFGLRATIKRLRVYCGKDDVVRINSEPGEYTEIELIIRAAGSNTRRTTDTE